jgi:putative oxidoreductase
MSKTSTASATRGHTDAGSRLLGRRALGAARGLLVIVFVIAGLTKLGGAHSMVKLFAQIGVGQSFRYLVGTLELAGAVALLIPSLVGPAALGLAALMTGALLTRVAVLHGAPIVELLFLLTAAAVAYAQRDQIRRLAASAAPNTRTTRNASR